VSTREPVPSCPCLRWALRLFIASSAASALLWLLERGFGIYITPYGPAAPPVLFLVSLATLCLGAGLLPVAWLAHERAKVAWLRTLCALVCTGIPWAGMTLTGCFAGGPPAPPPIHQVPPSPVGKTARSAAALSVPANAEAAYACLMWAPWNLGNPLEWAAEAADRFPTDPRFHMFLGDVYAGLAWGPYSAADATRYGFPLVEEPAGGPDTPLWAREAIRQELGPDGSSRQRYPDVARALEHYRAAALVAPSDEVVQLRLAAFALGDERARALHAACIADPENPLPAMALLTDACAADGASAPGWRGPDAAFVAQCERVPLGQCREPAPPAADPAALVPGTTRRSKRELWQRDELSRTFYERAYDPSPVFRRLRAAADSSASVNDAATLGRALAVCERCIRQWGSVRPLDTVRVSNVRYRATDLAHTAASCYRALGDARSEAHWRRRAEALAARADDGICETESACIALEGRLDLLWPPGAER
jgi:hypothetical protein